MKKTDLAYIPRMKTENSTGAMRPMTEREKKGLSDFIVRTKLKDYTLRSEVCERFGLDYTNACRSINTIQAGGTL